ncbi:MAG: AMP-binding protein [Burkholderiales bacterium]
MMQSAATLNAVLSSAVGEAPFALLHQQLQNARYDPGGGVTSDGVQMQRDDLHPFNGCDVAWLVETRAATRANHPFLVWTPFDAPSETWTFAAFRDDVARVAGGLFKRGVRSGDRILIHLDNCPEALVAWYACAWIGAVAVTTNARAAGAEMAYFTQHSAPVGGITQPKFAALVAAHCPGLRWIAITATDNGEPPAIAPERESSFAALFDQPAARRIPDPVAPMSVQYTSGTTSRPKGVLWTQANALWGGRVNAAHEDLRPDDVHLVHLPLYHTNAQAYSVLACLWAGATAVIQPRFSASRFWNVSLANRCTWTSLVPFCVKALMDHPVPPAHHYRLWGGAICEPPTDAHFRVKTIGWWGMTETITHGIVGSPHLPNVPMSIGRPAPEYEIAIVEDDAVPVRESRAIDPGGSGFLQIRGRRGLSLFAEYFGNPKATAESFDPDGWFRTGDRVDLLADGSIRFGDRTKDMLKVGGENVAASEIERVILRVAGVHECAIVAKKHSMLDEVPVAFVRPAANGTDDLAARVAAACSAELADFKRPREIRMVDDFPRSTLEKIAKVVLRRQIEEEG